MAITDILVVFGVFVGFGILIISKLRTKNPKRYEAIIGWVKDTKAIKESFKKSEPIHAPNIIPDSARIM